MKIKILLLFSIILGIQCNVSLQAQESVDLEVVWQKEVFPKDITEAYFSADGQWIYAAVGNTIEKISVSTGEFSSTFSPEGMSKGINGMDISELSNLIVTHDGNGGISLWDTHLEKAIKYKSFSTKINYDGAIAVAISPNEKYLSLLVTVWNSNTNERDGYFVIYDILNDTEIKRISTNQDCRTIKFSHNGKYFATGGYYKYNDGTGEKDYDQIILWSCETWEPIDTIENLEGTGEGYRRIKFSKDDKYLGCVRKGAYDARIYELNSLNLVKISEEGRLCFNIELLPDNNHYLLSYATWDSDFDLVLYDFNSTINNFPFIAEQMDYCDFDDDLKVFCCGGKYPLTILAKKTIGIETQFTTNELKYSYNDGKLIIDFGDIPFNQPEINIYNILGMNVGARHAVPVQHNGNTIETNIEYLSAGVYFVVVDVSGKRIVIKLMK
ncbi:T9SS type A sorting domain-containing protein [Bacteroidota bacterium]